MSQYRIEISERPLAEEECRYIATAYKPDHSFVDCSFSSTPEGAEAKIRVRLAEMQETKVSSKIIEI